MLFCVDDFWLVLILLNFSYQLEFSGCFATKHFPSESFLGASLINAAERGLVATELYGDKSLGHCYPHNILFFSYFSCQFYILSLGNYHLL